MQAKLFTLLQSTPRETVVTRFKLRNMCCMLCPQRSATFILCWLAAAYSDKQAANRQLCQPLLPDLRSARARNPVPHNEVKHHRTVFTSALMHHAQANLARQLVPHLADVLEHVQFRKSCYAGSLQMVMGRTVSC